MSGELVIEAWSASGTKLQYKTERTVCRFSKLSNKNGFRKLFSDLKTGSTCYKEDFIPGWLNPGRNTTGLTWNDSSRDDWSLRAELTCSIDCLSFLHEFFCDEHWQVEISIRVVKCNSKRFSVWGLWPGLWRCSTCLHHVTTRLYFGVKPWRKPKKMLKSWRIFSQNVVHPGSKTVTSACLHRESYIEVFDSSWDMFQREMRWKSLLLTGHTASSLSSVAEEFSFSHFSHILLLSTCSGLVPAYFKEAELNRNSRKCCPGPKNVLSQGYHTRKME